MSLVRYPNSHVPFANLLVHKSIALKISVTASQVSSLLIHIRLSHEWERLWRQYDCIGFSSTLQIILHLNGLHSCKLTWVQSLRLWSKQAENAKFNCCAAIYNDIYFFSSLMLPMAITLFMEIGSVQLCSDSSHMGQAGMLSWTKSGTHYLSFRCF